MQAKSQGRVLTLPYVADEYCRGEHCSSVRQGVRIRIGFRRIRTISPPDVRCTPLRWRMDIGGFVTKIAGRDQPSRLWMPGIFNKPSKPSLKGRCPAGAEGCMICLQIIFESASRFKESPLSQLALTAPLKGEPLRRLTDPGRSRSTGRGS